MSQHTCPNCGSEDLEAYEIDTATAPDGRTVTGCDYCIRGSRIVHGYAAATPCQVCGQVTESEACSGEHARQVAAESGWVVIDEVGAAIDVEVAGADGPDQAQTPAQPRAIGAA